MTSTKFFQRSPFPDEITRSYFRLMFEAGIRLSVANRILNGQNFEAHHQLELFGLQIRKLCELIAFACAHVRGGEVEKNMGEFFQPSKIFSLLEEIDPEFFPYPVKIVAYEDESGKPKVEMSALTNRFDRKKLLTAWGQMGNILHSGKVKNVFPKYDALPTLMKDNAQLNVGDIHSQIDSHLMRLNNNGECLLVLGLVSRRLPEVAHIKNGRLEKQFLTDQQDIYDWLDANSYNYERI